jgi:thermopsin
VVRAGSLLAIPVSEPGKYYVVVFPIPSVDYRPQIYLTNRTGLPIGIASFPAQPIITNELMSYFNITLIDAYNPEGESRFGAPNDGAGLQFNAVVVVKLADGREQYYWTQNVILFKTNETHLLIENSIWNSTTPFSALSRQSIEGSGKVYNSTWGEFYARGALLTKYSLPLSGYLVMKAYVRGGAVRVDFGYVIIQCGEYRAPIFTWYDNVTITPFQPAVDAYFEVTGAKLCGGKFPMNAELVFAGYCCYAWTRFNRLSASLALLYWNGSAWSSLPSIYNFGLTAESAITNINVTMLGAFAVLMAPGTFTPTMINPQPEVPKLPMTYVSYRNPVSGRSFEGYITQPVTVNIPSVIYVGSNERYVLQGYHLNDQWVTNASITIPPSHTWFATYNLRPRYQRQYLVSIQSPLPIMVNSIVTTNYTAWVEPGTALSITVHNYVLSNGTMLVPNVRSRTILINAPTALSILWSPRYLVTVTSTKPIYVNGESTVNYTAWLQPGCLLSINAPTYSELGGLIVLEPNATRLTLVVSKPATLRIAYAPNYTRLYAAISVIIAGVIVAALVGRRRALFMISIHRWEPCARISKALLLFL